MAEEKSVQGGKHIGRVLKEEGVEYYFGVTGGHIFPTQVGMGMAGIKMIHCRHEQAAGYAADAYARASGKVGICIGTAGPGMTNQISAIATAYFCKSPVVAFYGQHRTYEDGRGGLQESRADQILNSITKWTRRIIDPKTIAYFTKKACRDAMTYPQGPVALELPENIVSVRTPNSARINIIFCAIVQKLDQFQFSPFPFARHIVGYRMENIHYSVIGMGGAIHGFDADDRQQ